jgi:hypothetical protein
VLADGIADVGGGSKGDAGFVAELCEMAHPLFISRKQPVRDLNGQMIGKKLPQRPNPLASICCALLID